MIYDGLIYNATIATFDPEREAPYGLIKEGALLWKDGRICEVTSECVLENYSAKKVINAKGRLVTPGLIDCHTHLVYAGDRAQEFEWRLQGQSYQDIANAGGGIKRTVAETRLSSLDELYLLAKQRLLRLHRSGVTTVEIKSGYGLDEDTEIKMLQVVKQLAARLPLTIRATCLAAHTLPEEFAGRPDDYIHWVCTDLLPKVKEEELADAVDIFCESIAFSKKHAETLFAAASELGFMVKGHVEQLSQSGGTDVVCQFRGLSADHVEYLNEKQVALMKQSDTTAVLLPGAFYYLNETQKPPVQQLRDAGVPMAVATDLNPGTSPVFSITQAANMACVLFGLTPEEALLGITRHGAKALNLSDIKGQLTEGFDADVVLWPVNHPVELVYESPCVTPDGMWLLGEESEVKYS